MLSSCNTCRVSYKNRNFFDRYINLYPISSWEKIITIKATRYLFASALPGANKLVFFTGIRMLYFENFMKTNVSTDLKMLCIYFTFKRKIGCHRRLCNIFEVFSRALPERPEYIRGVFPSSNGKAREVAIETLSCHFNYFFCIYIWSEVWFSHLCFPSL